MVEIIADYDDVLLFLQMVALKAPQVLAAPLLMKADKNVTSWFLQWTDSHLKHHITNQKKALQDHSILTGFLSEVATRFQNTESLRSIVTYQREADREMHGWYRLPPTAQRLILTERAVGGINITLAPSTSIHHFINEKRDGTPSRLRAEIIVEKIFLPTAFCQALLQVHILAITDPKAPPCLYLLLNPLPPAGTSNAKHR